MIILKVIKNQGFTLSLEETFFKKPQGGGDGVNLTPSPFPASHFTVKLLFHFALFITDTTI